MVRGFLNCFFLSRRSLTLPETNIAPENMASQKERIVFQPSIFRGELLVSGRVKLNKDMGVSKKSGTPKSSILIGFSLINHPFWGTTIFGNTHILLEHSNYQQNPSSLLGWVDFLDGTK